MSRATTATCAAASASTVYDANGWTDYTLDWNGVKTDYTYDAAGKLLQVIEAQGTSSAKTRVNVWSGDNLVETTYRDASNAAYARVAYSYHTALAGFGKVATEVWTDLRTNVQNNRHGQLAAQDALAQRLNARGQRGGHVLFDQPHGQPRAALRRYGQQVSYTYDANGNVKTRTDAGNRVTRYDYDALNRVKQVTAADNGVIVYNYDTEGNLASVQNPRGLVTSYTYNGLGQVLTQRSPDTGLTTYTYDSAGRLQTMKTATGTTITYTWDLLNRLRSRTSGNATESWTYDEGTYGKGRLTRIDDATGQTTYAYTGAGELTTQVNTILSTSFTTRWAYDAAGRLLSLTYPNGLVLGYGYDGSGRLAAVTSNLAGASATVANSFLYQPATDRRYAWRFGNNLPRLVTLDADGRITQLAGNVHRLSYGYSNVDTVNALTDGVYPALNASFGYDAVDRLSSVSRSGDAQGFTWDRVGNRTAHTRQGNNYALTLDANSNRVTAWSGGGRSRSFGYDAAGNVRSDVRTGGAGAGNYSYSYDAFERMSGVCRRRRKSEPPAQFSVGANRTSHLVNHFSFSVSLSRLAAGHPKGLTLTGAPRATRSPHAWRPRLLADGHGKPSRLCSGARSRFFSFVLCVH